MAISALTPLLMPASIADTSGRIVASVPFIFQFAATSGWRLVMELAVQALKGRLDYRVEALKSMPWAPALPLLRPGKNVFISLFTGYFHCFHEPVHLNSA